MDNVKTKIAVASRACGARAVIRFIGSLGYLFGLKTAPVGDRRGRKAISLGRENAPLHLFY
jgi:hypothetical protein